MSLNGATNNVLMQKTTEELLHSNFIKQCTGELKIVFNGVMSQDAIVGLGEVLRSELHQNYPLSVVNKIFAIYIEMTQNVLHYSLEKTDASRKEIGKGAIIVLDNFKGYCLFTVNMVNEKQKGLLQGKIDKINMYDEDQIKDQYLNQRRRIAEGDSKGAGLGLIDIIRRSNNPLQYHFEKNHDNRYYFYLKTEVLTGQ